MPFALNAENVIQTYYPNLGIEKFGSSFSAEHKRQKIIFALQHFTMKALNSLINQYFGVILLLSAILGLVVPPFDIDTSLIIIFALGTVIFSSFFRIALNKELFRADWKSLPLYFVARFLVLPLIVYFIFVGFSEFYALAFFLLLLLPAAVSSPAFSAMFGGSVSLALKILVFSSFLSILSIPILSGWVLTRNVQIDSVSLFLIMVYTVVIPFVLHIPFRKSEKATRFFTTNNPVITALGLMTIFVFSTSKNREIIFSDPAKMLVYTLVAILFYLALYFFGFYMMRKQERSRRIAYSVSSGANNIGIGVTLTMLFFPGETNVFFIVSQLSWIFVLIPMRYFYDRMK